MYYEKEADIDGYFMFSRYSKERTARMTPIAHYHTSIEIYVCTKGKYHVMINGDTQELHEGEIAFVNQYTPHTSGIVSDEEAEELEVFVIVANAQYFNAKNEKIDYIQPFTPKKEGFDKIENLTRLAFSMKSGMNYELKLGFLNMLLGLIFSYCSSPEKQSNKKAQLTVDVMKYIESSYMENITLSSLARKFGYEESYLSRVFNKFAGVNLREYINRSRLRAVRKLLSSDTNISVQQATRVCGFLSPKTYYRVKKLYENDENDNF